MSFGADSRVFNLLTLIDSRYILFAWEGQTGVTRMPQQQTHEASLASHLAQLVRVQNQAFLLLETASFRRHEEIVRTQRTMDLGGNELEVEGARVLLAHAQVAYEEAHALYVSVSQRIQDLAI